MLKQLARRHPSEPRTQTRSPLIKLTQHRPFSPATERHTAAPQGLKRNRAYAHISTQSATKFRDEG
jgi:hypothetical protein